MGLLSARARNKGGGIRLCGAQGMGARIRPITIDRPERLAAGYLTGWNC